MGSSAVADVAIATGNHFSCVLLASGEVRCWGDNEEAHFSLSSIAHTAKPLRVSLPKPARLLRAKGSGACALLIDKSVYCWGYWFSKRQTNPPIRYPDFFAADATDVVVGGDYGCALHTAGTVSCWDSNQYGSLGTDTNKHQSATTPVLGLTNVVHLAADIQTCALVRDGTLWCWGEEDPSHPSFPNREGYDGPALGFSNPRSTPVPIDVASVRRLIVGPRLVCVLYLNDSASCYGGVLSRQSKAMRLERPMKNNKPSDPYRVVVPIAWKSLRRLTFGDNVRCWLTSDGSPRCRDDDNKAPTDMDDPVLRDDGNRVFPGDRQIHFFLRNVKQLEIGELHRCALLQEKNAVGMPNVWCWGLNFAGEIGLPPKKNDGDWPLPPNVYAKPVRVVW